jgi:hypothetical protein
MVRMPMETSLKRTVVVRLTPRTLYRSGSETMREEPDWRPAGSQVAVWKSRRR